MSYAGKEPWAASITYAVLPSRTELEDPLVDRLSRERAAEDAQTAPLPDSGDGREELVWAEFAEVGGGSTAWINLLIALDSADTEVGEIELLTAKGETSSQAAYWDWAWNTYQLAMSEVGPAESEARRLAVAYNLEELAQCGWCETPAVSGGMRQFEKADGTMASYHLGCLAESLREQGL